MSNERSASDGNLILDGHEINHQWSQGRRGRAAAACRAGRARRAGRPATSRCCAPLSELHIARLFAGFTRYDDVVTSCNAAFKLRRAPRVPRWCRDCPKCRFVFLAMAPFMRRERLIGHLRRATCSTTRRRSPATSRCCGVDGHKPFECVGEVEESVAAFRLLAADPRWADHAVVRAARERLLPAVPDGFGDPAAVLALSGDHDIPARLMPAVHARLGA